MREQRGVGAFVLLAVVLAGCAGEAQEAGPSPSSTDPNALPEGVANVLQGRVAGDDSYPIPNATVTVVALQINQTTDEAGEFRFENLEPRDYVVTASKEGYRSKTLRAIVEDGKAYELTFLLELKPNVVPYSEVLNFRGRISCQAAFAADPESVAYYDCGAVDPTSARAKDFQFQANGAQIVVEAFWQAAQSGANNLTLEVQSVGLTTQDIVFGTIAGESGLKLPISQSLMRSYYRDGGSIRATMSAAPGMLHQPDSYDAGFAFQQDFEVWVTVFYIDPGPPNYSVKKDV